MVRAFRQSQGADPADAAQVEWRSQKAMEGPGCPAEGEAAAWLVPKGPLQGILLDSGSCPQGPGSGRGAGRLAGLGTWDCDSGSDWLRAWSHEPAQVWPRARPGCFAGRMGTFIAC